MPTFGGGIKNKRVVGVIVVLTIVIIVAAAWKSDKLNRFLPEKLRHKTSNMSGFIGLTRSGIYTMGPGGVPGMPGIDLNTSTWV